LCAFEGFARNLLGFVHVRGGAGHLLAQTPRDGGESGGAVSKGAPLHNRDFPLPQRPLNL
jgi:hypothetical protein